jgi:hypothetical protein
VRSPTSWPPGHLTDALMLCGKLESVQYFSSQEMLMTIVRKIREYVVSA